MKNTRWLLPATALLLLIFTACASSAPRRRTPRAAPPPKRVEVGMTKSQVERVLGDPDTYAGAGGNETWHYYHRQGTAIKTQTVVHFHNGQVQSFRTNVPPPAANRPVVRQPTPGNHHAAPPPNRGRRHGSPPPNTGHGRAHGDSGHHGAGQATPHRGHRDATQRVTPTPSPTPRPAKQCRGDRDCSPSKQCKKYQAGRVCIGQGVRGDACVVVADCKKGLVCRPNPRKQKICQ